MSHVFYYYTTLDGFYSIIKDRQLLLTSLNNMNDPVEGSYSIEEFLSDIATIVSKHSSSEPYLKVLQDAAMNNKKAFTDLCKMPAEPYSICFSKKRDSISHWERYAQNMTGVCIGFDIDELYKINLPYFEAFSIKEVSYKEKYRIERLHCGIAEYIEQLKLESKTHISNEEFCKILNVHGYIHLAAAYQSILFFIKSSYWNEEEEIRLLYDDCAWNNKMNLYKKIEESWNIKLTDSVKQWHLSSGLSENQFIKLSIIRACRYLKLEKIWSSSLIPEILIGPFSRQNSDDLKAFIESSGLDLARTVVKKSDIKIQ